MCGICGVLYFNGEKPDKSVLARMRDSMMHRGPDDCGLYIDGPVGLGHRRLSIIDLSEAGRQPLSNEDGSVWIVFNGEIYNHEELRIELEGQGHRYVTETDTETIIHLYEEYGLDCVSRLNGMFAFAIWDAGEERIFLARDRIGIKPLYYLLDGEKIIFASELKAILEHPEADTDIDYGSLSDYLTYGYVGSPKTIFSGIRKLPPACTLKVVEGEAVVKTYWSMAYPENPFGDEAYHKEKIVEGLKDSIKLRLMSDVPLGAFLSGGIDSSAIVALMSELTGDVKTFSVGFTESSFNELDYARVIADLFGTDHHEFTVEMDAVKLIPKLLEVYDEPFADSSAIPTYIVSEMARSKVTVCLSGDGGDELFAGYDRYSACKVAQEYARIPKVLRDPVKSCVNLLPPSTANKNIIRMSQRFANAVDLPPEERYLDWITIYNEEKKNKLIRSEVVGKAFAKDSADYIKTHYKNPAKDFTSKTMHVDIKTYLPEDLLVKVDRASMAHSLEVRVPFLDHNLVEYSQTIPSALKFPGLKLKHILKKSLKKKLPKKIINRRKHGFGVPVGSWLKNELKEIASETLTGKDSQSIKYFRKSEIEKMLAKHSCGKQDHTYRIWSLLFFELWHRKYVSGEEIAL